MQIYLRQQRLRDFARLLHRLPSAQKVITPDLALTTMSRAAAQAVISIDAGGRYFCNYRYEGRVSARRLLAMPIAARFRQIH